MLFHFMWRAYTASPPPPPGPFPVSHLLICSIYCSEFQFCVNLPIFLSEIVKEAVNTLLFKIWIHFIILLLTNNIYNIEFFTNKTICSSISKRFGPNIWAKDDNALNNFYLMRLSISINNVSHGSGNKLNGHWTWCGRKSISISCCLNYFFDQFYLPTESIVMGLIFFYFVPLIKYST